MNAAVDSASTSAPLTIDLDCGSPALPATIAFNAESGDGITVPTGADVTIAVPAGRDIVLDGHDLSNGPLFTVPAGTTLVLSGNDAAGQPGLTLQNGDVGLFGGAVDNAGTLTVSGWVYFLDNSSMFDGGAISSIGTVQIQGPTYFTGNTAIAAGGAIDNSGGQATIAGATFTGNQAGGQISDGYGGAIASESGASPRVRASGTGSATPETTVTDSTFTGNSATGGGGAIHSGGMPFSVNRSVFDDNTSVGGFACNGGCGGAIDSEQNSRGVPVRASGAGSAALLPTISNSTFTGNSAGFRGGAINDAGVPLSVINTVFSGNTVTSSGSQGGAVTVFATVSTPTVTISDSAFSGDSAQAAGGMGGAIFDGGANVIVDASTFDGETAGGGGGAIEAEGMLQVSNSSFYDNQAPDGGGLDAVELPGGAAVTVDNSTFDANQAASGGGGSVNGDPSSNTITFNNTIFANPTGGGNCVDQSPPAVFTGDHNLDFPASASDACTAISSTAGDPALGPLAANGSAVVAGAPGQPGTGPVETMALGTGSAAIGAGDGGVCTAAPVSSADERGAPRSAANCDIGAYQTEPQVIRVAAAPGTVFVDGVSTVSGTVYGQQGQGLPGETVQLQVGAGGLDGGGLSASVTTDAEGNYSATFRAPPILPAPDPVTVTASVYSDLYGNLTATAPVDVTVPPVGLTVAANPGIVPVNGASTVSGFVYGPGNQPASGQSVKLTVSAGSLGGSPVPLTVKTDASGDYTAPYTAPAAVPSPNPVTVTASVYSLLEGTLTATTAITVTSPPPGTPTLSVAANPPAVLATEPATPPSVTVSGVVYRDGGPLSAAEVQLSTSDGSLSPVGSGASSGTIDVTTSVYGDYSAVLTPPAVAGPETVTITASLPGFPDAGLRATSVQIVPLSLTVGADPSSVTYGTPSTVTLSGTLTGGGSGVGDQSVVLSVPAGDGSFGPPAGPAARAAATGAAAATVSTTVATQGDGSYSVTLTTSATPPASGIPVAAASDFATASTTIAVSVPSGGGGGGGGGGPFSPFPVSQNVPTSGGTVTCGTTTPLSQETLTGSAATVLSGPQTAPSGSGQVQVTFMVQQALPTTTGGSVMPNVLVYYWDAALGAWIAVPTTAGGTTASAQVPAGSQAALLQYTVVQPPDAVGSWADPYILMLESLGIVNGYPDCTFQPNQPLDRYEMAKLLALALHLPVAGADPAVLARYSDAASIPAWAAPYVTAVTRAGDMIGFALFNAAGVEYADDFDGTLPVSRDQFATVMGRLLGPNAPEAKLSFADDAQIEPWALVGMERSVAAKIIQGFPGNLLKPLADVTRAQAAKMIAMYLVLPASRAASGVSGG